MVCLVEPKLTDEGVGAKAKRLIPNNGNHLDPFVIFDEYFISPDASFPMHPHGGFEGFQFLVEGATDYADVFGNKGLIRGGEIRRFLAGEGFAHSEHPRYDGTVRGYLVWMKLPSEMSNVRSVFQEWHGEDVEVEENEDMRITKIFGEGAPVPTVTPAVFKHVVFKRESSVEFELASGWSGFLYVSKGELECCSLVVREGKGAILEPGNLCEAKGTPGTEMVLLRGRRIKEEIVQDGHFVK
ncbi:MAG: pirin family protein [Thermoplasmatota archaeon]